MKRKRLAKELSAWFSPRARSNGAALAPAVSFVAGPSGKYARVPDGDHVYEVRAALGGDTFHVACSCPLFRLGLDGCRHVWAVVVATDRAAISGIWPRRIGEGARAVHLALSGRAAIVRGDTTSRARIETLSGFEGNRARLADAMSTATAVHVDLPIPRNGPRGRSTLDTDSVGRWKRESR